MDLFDNIDLTFTAALAKTAALSSVMCPKCKRPEKGTSCPRCGERLVSTQSHGGPEAGDGSRERVADEPEPDTETIDKEASAKKSLYAKMLKKLPKPAQNALGVTAVGTGLYGGAKLRGMDSGQQQPQRRKYAARRYNPVLHLRKKYRKSSVKPSEVVEKLLRSK